MAKKQRIMYLLFLVFHELGWESRTIWCYKSDSVDCLILCQRDINTDTPLLFSAIYYYCQGELRLLMNVGQNCSQNSFYQPSRPCWKQTNNIAY